MKLFKVLFAVTIIVLLIYIVDPGKLWGALSQITWEVLFCLALLAVLLVLVSAVKWRYFLEALGRRVSTLYLFNLYIIGYFVNLLLPSYLGGDVVRSWYAGKKVGQHAALSATILERYTGFIAMLALALVCMWFVKEVTLAFKVTILLIAVGAAGITLLALSPRVLTMLERYAVLHKVIQHLKKVQEGFLLAKQDRVLLVKAFALSFLFHTLTVINTIAAAYAVGWYSPPIVDLFVVLPLILLIGALPVAPSGLGIQEGAFYFFLHAIGATPAQALGVGVVLRAKSYVLALIGGLLWLKVRGENTINNVDHG